MDKALTEAAPFVAKDNCDEHFRVGPTGALVPISPLTHTQKVAVNYFFDTLDRYVYRYTVSVSIYTN